MSQDTSTSLAALRTSDGGNVLASKDELSAHSRYFKVLFNGPLSKPCQRDFHIPGVSAASLQAIVTYCCTGNVVITVDDVQDVIVAANQFLVDGLCDECCAFILRHIDIENCVMVFKMASFYNFGSLHQSAFRFLLDHMELVYSHSIDFPRLGLPTLEDLLSSDELKVRREEVVWKAAMLCIKANSEEQKQYLDTLVPKIRFGLMKSSFLKQVMRSKFIRKNKHYKTIVQRCYDLKKSDGDACPSESVERMFVQRAPAEILFVYGGVCSASMSNTWEIYNYKTNKWSMVRTDFIEQTVFGPQCASVGQKIYVMGTDVTTMSPFYYSFDPVTRVWSPTQHMDEPRALFPTAVIGSLVYCIGGTPDGRRILDTAERYDTVTDTWQAVRRMNYPRLGAAASSCGGRVYVVGGASPKEPLRSAMAYNSATMSKPLRSAETYDPDTDQWTVIAPMKTGRIFPGLVTYRDKVYAIGGLQEKSSVCEAYDPMTGKWSKKSKGKALRGRVIAAVLNDSIYAIGETNHKDCKRVMDCLSADDGKWHTLPGSYPMRWFYSACVLKNLPNTLEFFARPSQDMG